MSEINPFYTPHRSSPISMFVDNSLPAELMLRAGLAKQAEQDRMLGISNTLGAYDQNALEGGDTAYRDQIKASVNKFVDENNNIDLTVPTNQAKTFQFIRGIQQDEKLKNISANYAARQAYLKQLSELQAAGNQDFKPATAAAEERYRAYVDSGEQGGIMGNLMTQKALNLQDKKQTYVDNIKASSGEGYTSMLKGLEGLLFKTGVKGVYEKTTNSVIKGAVNDYANSPEGGQEAMIYQAGIKSGAISKDVSLKDYLLNSLYQTAKEFQWSGNSVSYDAALNKDLGITKEKEATADPIVEPGATFDMSKTSVAELKKIMNDPKAPAIQKQRAQAQHDAILNVVSNSPEGKAIQKTLTSLVEKDLPMPTGTEFMSGISKNAKFAPGEKEAETALFNKLAANMPLMIKKQILENKNTTFAERLADPNNPVFKLAGEPGKYKGVEIAGTGVFWSWKGLGLNDAQAKKLQSSARLGTDLQTASGKYVENVFWADASSKIRNGLESWDKRMDEMGDGTSAKPMFTSRPATEKEQNAMKTELGSANPNLFEAVDKQNNLLSGTQLNNLLANVGDSDISIRPSVSGRAIEITRKVKVGDTYEQQTFWIQEKGGVPTQTFDRLFQAATGNSTAGMNASASDKLYKEVSNTPVPLVNVMGDFRDVLPATVNPKLTVAKDRSGKGMYVLGDELGSFTNQHVIDKFNQLKAIGSNQATLNKYQNIITSTLMSEGIPTDKIASYYTYLATGKKDGLDSEDFAELNNALDNKFSADGYNNMIFVAGLMSLKN